MIFLLRDTVFFFSIVLHHIEDEICGKIHWSVIYPVDSVAGLNGSIRSNFCLIYLLPAFLYN
jgi:hypothetical protein